ncbi:DUF3169 family protein [Oceanobacillus massiliensis]|uniref:DUF3169 family protein n=1 Tax=Oceanobacillus massiliensis TaxID=1465765 RepID=UPI000287E57F|nr:DUF3169 family protein [Oceanobacillus massiliensis]
MKMLMQILIGGAIGFIVATLILNNFDFIDFAKYADEIIIGILVIIAVLLILSVILYRQIRKLNNTDLSGDAEDEVDELMYKKFTDYSLFVQSSTTFSILALCTALITSERIILITIAIAGLILSYLLTSLSTTLLRKVYPERNLPSLSDPNYAEKLLEISDDGEKHVMLNGLYKTYSFVNLALIIAIILAAFYSISSDSSQLFSIIVMSAVLLLTNAKYALSIRNK